MLFDTHMHTRFSTDSRMTIAEAMARGRELGLGITVTEHLDLDYPEPKAYVFDVDEYLRQYAAYRSDTVLLGIEIGMRVDQTEGNAAVVASHAFDFVLGSIHVIDRIDIYLKGFYLRRSKATVYGQYLATMADCLECHEFIDSLGHIDYIARYARYDDPELHYGEFAAAVDAVLGRLAAAEKALEINTRRLGDADAVAALLPIYHRFRQLGGKLVTIGSDAHRPKEIGKHFAVAVDMAAACGLRPVYYKERKPEYVKL
jgi:histidinol-phosphatase (PHP family)